MRFLRYFTQYFFCWFLTAFYILFITCFTFLTLGLFGKKTRAPFMRFWGKAMCWLHGVSIDNQARTLLDEEKTRIYIFNHGSNLDMFLIAAVVAPNAVPIIKKELFYIPLLGWVLWLLGLIPINRQNKEKAYQSLEEISLRMKRENLAVAIAPEGTRSDDGSLGQFKKGAFHLSQISQVPIYPIVLQGTTELWPRTEKLCKPGTVTIQSLEPIEAVQTGEDLYQVAATTRQRYLDSLG